MICKLHHAVTAYYYALNRDWQHNLHVGNTIFPAILFMITEGTKKHLCAILATDDTMVPFRGKESMLCTLGEDMLHTCTGPY